MSRTTRLAVVAAVLSTVLLGAGCTSVVAGAPAADPAPAPTEGPGSDPVKWADRYCGSLLPFLRTTLATPNFDNANDLPAIRRVFSDYLGGVVTALGNSRTGLGAVGRSPVSGGDEAVTRTDGVLRQLEQEFGSIKNSVDTVDPNNAPAFQGVLADAQSRLDKITAPNALGDLAELPRLDKAAGKAASCQQLSSLASGG